MKTENEVDYGSYPGAWSLYCKKRRGNVNCL